MRKLKKDSFGTTYFYLLVILVVFICLMAVFDFGIHGQENKVVNYSLVNLITYNYANYTNMTRSERWDFMNESQGCNSTEVWEPLVHLDMDWILSFAYGWHWPCTGYKLAHLTFMDYLDGNWDKEDVRMGTDVWGTLAKVLTLDFVVFKYLGFLGVVIRLFVFLSMVVIVYLMLPFTG